MNIKQLSNKIISKVFKIISLIYDYNSSKNIKRFYNKILSLWLKSSFKSCKSAVFNFPIYIIGAKYISIGGGFSALNRFRIEAWDKFEGETFNPSIEIGNNVHFNFNCHRGAINKIVIMDNVLVGSNVLITDHSHGDSSYESLRIVPSKRKLVSKGAVVIEENVWIGENVSVLPNVTLGKNCIIGANSVVTKDVPAFSIVAGNPAKVIKLVKN
jgi:acetyltransferase-like isoleucine patch superfamily enzyme